MCTWRAVRSTPAAQRWLPRVSTCPAASYQRTAQPLFDTADGLSAGIREHRQGSAMLPIWKDLEWLPSVSHPMLRETSSDFQKRSQTADWGGPLTLAPNVDVMRHRRLLARGSPLAKSDAARRGEQLRDLLHRATATFASTQPRGCDPEFPVPPRTASSTLLYQIACGMLACIAVTLPGRSRQGVPLSSPPSR